MVVSVNYLRLRSARFAPAFLLASFRAAWQAARAEGYRGGRLLAAPHATYWTLTAWDSLESMHAYRDSGHHGSIMPLTPGWGAAAAFAHWEVPGGRLPSWGEAARHLEGHGAWLPAPGMARDRVKAPPDDARPWRGFFPLPVPRLRRRGGHRVGAAAQPR